MALNSIESSAALLSSVGPASSGQAGLEAQQRLLEKKLSECVNCDSARTPEGKAEIEAITAKLSEVREKLKLASGASQGDTLSRGNDLASPTIPGRESLPVVETSNRSDRSPARWIGPEGGYIDTHA